MPDRKPTGSAPRLDHEARTRIAVLLRAIYLRPETSPAPDDQINLLMELRRKERERYR